MYECEIIPIGSSSTVDYLFGSTVLRMPFANFRSFAAHLFKRCRVAALLSNATGSVAMTPVKPRFCHFVSILLKPLATTSTLKTDAKPNVGSGINVTRSNCADESGRRWTAWQHLSFCNSIKAECVVNA